MVLNKVNGAVRSCAVQAPGFGNNRKDNLLDLSILTGGSVISGEMGTKLEKLELRDLGKARKVKIDAHTTTIIDGMGTKEAVETWANSLREQKDKTKNIYEQELLETRLARLIGGIAVLNVGGSTEVEVKEKKDRIDDAIHATKAAIEEGVVPGGGLALLRASLMPTFPLEDADERSGRDLLLRACQSPMFSIATNAGKNGETVVNKVSEQTGSNGYNALTDKYEDLVLAGVIDPTKVVRCALQNAASIAGLLITTEAIISELPPKD